MDQSMLFYQQTCKCNDWGLNGQIFGSSSGLSRACSPELAGVIGPLQLQELFHKEVGRLS
jgi:hypothetical protein